MAADFFGPELAPVTDGLGFLPYGNGVRYGAGPRPRPLLEHLVADGTVPTTFASDDGVGLVHEGTALVEVVSEVDGKAAHRASRGPDDALEERLEARLLPGA